MANMRLKPGDVVTRREAPGTWKVVQILSTGRILIQRAWPLRPTVFDWAIGNLATVDVANLLKGEDKGEDMAKDTKPKGGVIGEINRRLAESKKKGDVEVELTALPEPPPVMVDGELPGMETEKIPELIRAGKSYNQAKKARMKMLETEVERKAIVEGLMHQHGLKRYKFGKLTIEMTTTEKLKVSEDDDE